MEQEEKPEVELVVSQEEMRERLFKLIESGNKIKSEFDSNRYILNIDQDLVGKFDNWKKTVGECLNRSFNIKNNQYKSEFDESGKQNNHSILLSHEALYNESCDKINTLKSIRDRCDYIPCQNVIDEKRHITYNNETKSFDTNRVFIVHGHDTALKVTVARMLEHLDLTPIILHEQSNNGKTIIEKFEKNAETCGFAVILLTADDWGCAKKEVEDSKMPRARQNVIFEMGFFMGKLSRDRVFLLLDKGVEKPSDLDGIVYHSTNTDEWKLKLVKELKSRGYNVDANKLL